MFHFKNTISHLAAIAAGAVTFKVLKDNGADDVVMIAGTGLVAGVTDTAVYTGLSLLETQGETSVAQLIINTTEDDNESDMNPEIEEEHVLTIAEAFEYFEDELEQAAMSEEIFEKLKSMISEESFDENAVPLIQLALQDMYDYEAFNNNDAILNRAHQLYINLGLIIEEEPLDKEETTGEEIHQEDHSDEEVHHDEVPVEESEHHEDTSKQFAEEFVKAAEGGDDQVQQILQEMDGETFGGQIPEGTIEGSVLDFARGEIPLYLKIKPREISVDKTVKKIRTSRHVLNGSSNKYKEP